MLPLIPSIAASDYVLLQSLQNSFEVKLNLRVDVFSPTDYHLIQSLQESINDKYQKVDIIYPEYYTFRLWFASVSAKLS